MLIVDVRMPGMDGLQLQRELRRRGYPAPLVFCSAHGDIPMSVRALRGGAVNFLEKPYDARQMVRVVSEQLGEAERLFARDAEQRTIRACVELLTPREREVPRHVVDGRPSQRIARLLGASVKTVDVHRARIKAKTGAESLAVLVRDVLRHQVEI